jgi:ubiquinone/menaquinone biosynthesis C-methylase UbiE
VKDPGRYYDDFSLTYDAHREAGYHAFVDDFEAACVRAWLGGPRVLEVGCGTGQVLRRVRRFAPQALGVDLSRGMLRRARERGLPVAQASAMALPFRDGGFDLVYSFKVLPHLPELARALAEIERVLAPGGHAILEFYNPRSARGAWKRLRWWNVSVGAASHDREIHTSYHTPAEARRALPAGLRPVGARGAIVLTPHPGLHRLPLVGPALRAVEGLAGRGPLARLAGFYLLVAERVR